MPKKLDSASLRLRRNFWAWSILFLLVLAPLLIVLLRGPSIESSIFRLLPESDRNPSIETSRRFFQSRLAKNVVFVVGHPDGATSRAGGTAVRDELLASGLIEELPIASISETGRSYYELYFPHRSHILDRATRVAVATEDGTSALLAENERRLYSPLSSAYGWALEDDPLLLFPRFLESLPGPPGQTRLDDGWLVAEEGEIVYHLLHATLDFEPDDRAIQRQFVDQATAIGERLRAKDPNFEWWTSGWVFHASAGRIAAERDVKRLSIASVVGIVTLCLLVFRTMIVLAHLLLPIVFGFMAATLSTLLLFGEIHLLTLGFGTSLVGISVDYVFHYLCAEDPTPRARLRRIYPAITAGLATTCLGYFALAFSPLPGLTQMAFFSTVGLVAAYLTVLLATPYLAQSCRSRPIPIKFFERGARQIAAISNRGLMVGSILLLSGFGLALPSIPTRDDIRELQDPSEENIASDRRVQEILGSGELSAFLLVEGATPQQVLENEEELRDRLPEFSFRGITEFLPSIRRQRENLQRLRDRCLADGENSVEAYFQHLEFEPEVVTSWRTFIGGDEAFLELEQWLESSVSRELRTLWQEPGGGVPGTEGSSLDRAKGRYATIGILEGASIPPELLEIAFEEESLSVVHPVEDLNGVLSRARSSFTLRVSISYLIVAALVLLRYGSGLGFRILATPTLAAAGTILILAALGEPLTLFHGVGLLLVLGIGVDYALFFAEAGEVEPGTLQAVLLSAGTTVLSFGVLSLSTLPVLVGIGTTVVVGIVLSLALSPLAACPRPGRGTETP